MIRVVGYKNRQRAGKKIGDASKSGSAGGTDTAGIVQTTCGRSSPMKKSKPYSALAVKDVQLAPILAEHAGKDLWVGIDVGKEFLLVVLFWGEGRFCRPWRVRNPGDLA